MDAQAAAASLDTLHAAGVLTDQELEEAKARLAEPAPAQTPTLALAEEPAQVPDPAVVANLDALKTIGALDDEAYTAALAKVPTVPAPVAEAASSDSSAGGQELGHGLSPADEERLTADAAGADEPPEEVS